MRETVLDPTRTMFLDSGLRTDPIEFYGILNRGHIVGVEKKDVFFGKSRRAKKGVYRKKTRYIQ